MTKIAAFKAVRPTRDKAYLLSSRPYYMYKKNLLKAKLESNPYTFLHVINPEFHKNNRTKPNTVERFEKVKEKYEEFKNEGYFIQDKKDSIYIYRQQNEFNEYIGIIAGASVDDYIQGNIKVHENTLSQREKVFKLYLDVCQFNAEPVLLTYKDNDSINTIIDKYTKTRSEYEFTNTAKLKHDLWVVDKPEDIKKLVEAFSNVNEVYIADGHHRCSSSVLYALDQRKKGKSKKDGFNYFMSYFIAESKLKIYDYNRIVSNLNGLTEEEFLQQLEEKFTVKKVKRLSSPQQLHDLTMCLGKNWYSLSIKPEYIRKDDPVGSLDAQLLSELILDPILGIKDLKTDDRVSFIEGTKGMKGIQQQINSGKGKVAFALYPVSIEQLKRVADTNNIMPPKSTWIEPKMRSGLTVYEF